LPEKFILITFSDGILEVLPQNHLKDQEDYLLKKLTKVKPDIDDVLPVLDIDISQEPPDDIAILMIARGYHDNHEANAE